MDNRNDTFTPQGDGSSQPDPNSETNYNLNPNNHSNAEAGSDASADVPDQVDGAPASPPKPLISEARLRANRQNAQKSTGPKTARGKAHSRRNQHLPDSVGGANLSNGSRIPWKSPIRPRENNCNGEKTRRLFCEAVRRETCDAIECEESLNRNRSKGLVFGNHCALENHAENRKRKSERVN